MMTYANEITIKASHTKPKTQLLIQSYLHKIYEWATTNNLHISTDKTKTTLFHQTQLNMTQPINSIT